MKKIKLKTSETGVFFSSDFHYGHANICGGITKWVDLPFPYKEWKDQKAKVDFCIENGVRPFATLEEMNEAIVDGINSTVGQDDHLFFQGDWSFGSSDNIKLLRDRIVCRNVHFVFGNHDQHIMDERKGFQRLFSSVERYNEIYVDDNLVCLFHYKPTVWNRSHQGSYFLYGHSHAHAEHVAHGRSMDVGIDNAYEIFGQYRPFSWQEVVKHLKSRNPVILDHHLEAGR